MVMLNVLRDLNWKIWGCAFWIFFLSLYLSLTLWMWFLKSRILAYFFKAGTLRQKVWNFFYTNNTTIDEIFRNISETQRSRQEELTFCVIRKKFVILREPIPCHWLFLPLKNMRKPEVFWCFQGYKKTPGAWVVLLDVNGL